MRRSTPMLGAALTTLALAAGPAWAQAPGDSPTAADTAALPLAGVSGWMLVAAGGWLLTAGVALLFFISLFKTPGRGTPMLDHDPLDGQSFERELEASAERSAARRRTAEAAEEARRAAALKSLAKRTRTVLGNEAHKTRR
jgi:hypothetical protein